jgi:hypothetical protein
LWRKPLKVPVVVHVNGYDLGAPDWLHVNFGARFDGMGRVPAALLCAAHVQADRIIWSTGATYRALDGEIVKRKCPGVVLPPAPQGAFSEARETYALARKWLLRGAFRMFPEFEQFDLDELEARVAERSVLEEASYDTATSLMEAVRLINEVFEGEPGVVYTVSSANHMPRVLRDAMAVWKHGRLRGVDLAKTIRNRHLVRVVAWPADSCYGDGEVQDTLVDDLGKSLVPR